MNSHSLKKAIVKNLSNFVRNLIIINITGNLGKIVEDEDKITCYVKKSKCKNNSFKKHRCIL
jgi:hypothetical protein